MATEGQYSLFSTDNKMILGKAVFSWEEVFVKGEDGLNQLCESVRKRWARSETLTIHTRKITFEPDK